MRNSLLKTADQFNSSSVCFNPQQIFFLSMNKSVMPALTNVLITAELLGVFPSTTFQLPEAHSDPQRPTPHLHAAQLLRTSGPLSDQSSGVRSECLTLVCFRGFEFMSSVIYAVLFFNNI